MVTDMHQERKPHWGHKVLKSDYYDSYWCMDCWEWTEPKCSDAQCEYCAERPDEPTFSIA